MTATQNKKGRLGAISRRVLAVASAAALVASLAVLADDFSGGRDSQHDKNHFELPVFFPGNLVLSRSVYDNQASNVTVGEALPPDCAPSTGGCVTAAYNGTYPEVFNNAPIDGSFGITSKIYLDQITPFGWTIGSLEVPNNLEHGIGPSSDQLVTSFSSKSEMGLHLSLDGKYLTFMGYVSPVNALDVSNANTPGAFDPTNPVGTSVYRAAAKLDAWGHFHFTETNAYSGNNGRSAILNNIDGVNFFYTAGNAGNGSNPQPENIVLGAGAQIFAPSEEPESAQTPPVPSTPLGNFNVTELGDKADKLGKDDNFRGETIFNNVLYYTKGSGSNGVDTVFFVDTTGTACPKGVGLPVPGAALPATPIANFYPGGTPTNMCILAGFPTDLAKTATSMFPFGLWFADANTLYVADEGDGADGSTLYTHAAAQTTAGLQKWVFNSSANEWQLAYTLQAGLNLGTPYTVPGYPTGTNAATSLPWSPATDGLRNLTGQVDGHGLVTIWAITSTVSGGGDQGADPNKLVAVTDQLSATTAPSWAKFYTVRSAGFGEVLRGVSFTPGSFTDDHR